MEEGKPTAEAGSNMEEGVPTTQADSNMEEGKPTASPLRTLKKKLPVTW
jgi:hypothetical protein